MPRRLVLAAACTAVLAGGAAAPAMAAVVADPTVVCVLTSHDQKTGKRQGVCVWVPVESPFAPKPS